jgi:PiT family inorganic phosphate transporter/sodium-dependent phosphate transporter
LLWKDNYTLYFPGNPEDGVVPDFYVSDLKLDDEVLPGENRQEAKSDAVVEQPEDIEPSKVEENPQADPGHGDAAGPQAITDRKRQKELETVDSLPWSHPMRIFVTLKLIISYGITRDVIHHQSRGLEEVHKRAPVFDNRVEYLWTTAQICSAMVR